MLRYLTGTISSGLIYRRFNLDKTTIEGHVDVDYIGNVDIKMSLFGYVFTLFSTVICWRFSMQSIVVYLLPSRAYHTHKRGKEGNVVEGDDDWKDGYCTRLYDCLL